MDGWVEGLQQWLAEQHESDYGPQLGQSWGSLLITTRIRPRLLTAFDSALLAQTSSPFFTCSFLLALQQKWFVLIPRCSLTSNISPRIALEQSLYFHGSACFWRSLWFKDIFNLGRAWPLIKEARVVRISICCDYGDVEGLLWFACWSLLKENQFQR